MKRIAIHIPLQLNDGSPVASELLEIYEDAIGQIAAKAKRETGIGEEGFAIAYVIGCWRSPSGQMYREPVHRYELDVADAEYVVEDVRQLADRVRDELDQEAVYVTVAEIDSLVATELVATS